MSRVFGAALAALLAVVVATPRVAVASASSDLERALAQYHKLEFIGALKTYARVTADSGATPDLRARAYLGEGFCLVALGHVAKARRALRRAFLIAPELAVPRTSRPSCSR